MFTVHIFVWSDLELGSKMTEAPQAGIYPNLSERWTKCNLSRDVVRRTGDHALQDFFTKLPEARTSP